MIDPASIALDPTQLEDAVGRINARFEAAKAPQPEVRYAAGDLPRASSLAELLEQYDYGEPLWNGTLMLLAREMSVAPPTTIEISSLEDLPSVDVEYITHFHHGDVVVKGDLGAFESTWITGNLSVQGVAEASYLDAYQDLMVGGDVRCRAIQMMGLSLIAGVLEVERFAYIWSQGENWVLGGVCGPNLLGEYESVDAWDASGVEHHVNLEDDPEAKAALADLLGTHVDPEDEYAYPIIDRAFQAARADTD